DRALVLGAGAVRAAGSPAAWAVAHAGGRPGPRVAVRRAGRRHLAGAGRLLRRGDPAGGPFRGRRTPRPQHVRLHARAVLPGGTGARRRHPTGLAWPATRHATLTRLVVM